MTFKFKQISKKSVVVFCEVFLQTKLWKVLFSVMKSITRLPQQEKIIDLFIQFSNFISLALGNMFILSSKDIRYLIDLSTAKVFLDIMAFLDEMTTDIQNSNSFYKISTLFIVEVCVWALFTSLHLVPNYLIEFQHCDGYELLRKLFSTINSQKTLNDKDENWSRIDDFLLQFQQQKLLTILHVMITLVLDLTLHIQLVNQEEAIQEEIGQCKRNQHIFELLVFLYDNTDMSQIGEGESSFVCKRELLDHVLSNLTLSIILVLTSS